jgi:tungstate transport system substrate-binding protein
VRRLSVRTGSAAVIALLAMAVITGCGPDGRSAGVRPARPQVILATTTSTQDSGLLDVLVPAFERETGYELKVIAVGSGAAMQMGERGDADVLLVHSPAAEEKFVADGFGVERTRIMHNDFVMVGTRSDPARLSGSRTAVEAMVKIVGAGASFISRGDNSGTDALEKELWRSAIRSVPRGQSWYLETGQGMNATLTVTREKRAYTVADRATFLSFPGRGDLAIVLEGDPALLNVYHVILPNPAKLPKTNTEGARAFKDFLLSERAQQIIGDLGRDQYGQPLFVPDAGKPDPQRH